MHQQRKVKLEKLSQVVEENITAYDNGAGNDNNYNNNNNENQTIITTTTTTILRKRKIKEEDHTTSNNISTKHLKYNTSPPSILNNNNNNNTINNLPQNSIVKLELSFRENQAGQQQPQQTSPPLQQHNQQYNSQNNLTNNLQTTTTIIDKSNLSTTTSSSKYSNIPIVLSPKKKKHKIKHKLNVEVINKKTRVVRIRKKNGETVKNCDVYVGNKCFHGGWRLMESKWANPFEKNCKTKQECLDKYKEYILNQPDLFNSLNELKGKTLGCFCELDERPCHADVLVELVEKYCCDDDNEKKKKNER
ncbi:hypothetical protein ABK040_012340 [Willaertia magna]